MRGLFLIITCDDDLPRHWREAERIHITTGGSMKVLQGQLKRLGASAVNLRNHTVEYSLIEIGSDIKTDVLIDRKLDNFLSDGLRTSSATTLWLIGKAIMAVQIEGQPRYYGKANPFLYVAALVFLGVTLWSFSVHWALGLGLMLITGWRFIWPLVDYQGIAALGGIKV
jgi:hypothetical protein